MSQLALFPDWRECPYSGATFCPECLALRFNVAGAHMATCSLVSALPMVAR